MLVFLCLRLEYPGAGAGVCPHRGNAGHLGILLAPPRRGPIFPSKQNWRSKEMGSEEFHIRYWSKDEIFLLLEDLWKASLCCWPQPVQRQQDDFQIRATGQRKTAKKINMRASKIWPGANKNVVLSLKVKTESFSNFKSTNKNLESDIIDQDEIPHTFTRRNKKESISIPRSCQKDYDLGTFCVRFKACYTLGLIDENLEYSIELFPASKEAVLAQGSSQSGWIRVYSGEFSPWEQQPWDPCIPWSPPPFILSGTPFCHAPRAPPMEEIRKEMKKMLWPSYGTEDQPEQGEWAIHIPSW